MPLLLTTRVFHVDVSHTTMNAIRRSGLVLTALSRSAGEI
jgi:hypothetical protein